VDAFCFFPHYVLFFSFDLLEKNQSRCSPRVGHKLVCHLDSSSDNPLEEEKSKTNLKRGIFVTVSKTLSNNLTE
jgi:hypothetical protein